MLGGLIASFILLVAGTVFLLNTDAFQNKLLKHATRLLSEKLQTRVEIDSVSIGLFSQDVNLFGMDVEDLQHRKMFQLNHLTVNVRLLPLLHNEICIKGASIDGVRAYLHKSKPDTAANYQFIIDAFKRDTLSVDKEKKKEDKTKKKLSFNLRELSLSHVDINYNSFTKKGPMDNRITIGNLLWTIHGSQYNVSTDNLRFVTDNHLPRKNTGKPKRGAFDVGHFDINASLNADITKAIGDSILITINQCNALDKGSGLMLKSLTANVLVSKGIANLSDVVIQLPNTQLQFANGTIQLPSKKLERPLEFSTSPISGRVILKDIARPFAPVLSKFNIPLSLRVNFSGNAEQMKFQNVSVGTEDKQLSISANGSITGLKDKHQLAVRFHVNKMIAKGGSKERIINQFPVKKFMMKQLHNLGTIHYTGDFSVLWKKETFQGLLNTVGGRINFNFSLDELNKYVYGTARTDSFMLGKVMDMPDIGKIACKANFKFDISKPRTAKMRQQKGGKLPIGQMDAEVYEAKYKKIKVRDIVANIQSDGAVAEGNITMKGGRVDLLCSFSFTNTNEMRKTKIKPGIRFHKLSEEKRAEKEEKKAAKRAEKEEKKAAKQAEKAEKKAAKQAEKEERKRLKEEKRAAKKAAKAEPKAALLQ